jgi:hypothetical protein
MRLFVIKSDCHDQRFRLAVGFALVITAPWPAPGQVLSGFDEHVIDKELGIGVNMKMIGIDHGNSA